MAVLSSARFLQIIKSMKKLLILSIYFAGCGGSPDNTTKVVNPVSDLSPSSTDTTLTSATSTLTPSTSTAAASCKQQLLTTQSDYDGDGISDYDEIYGWNLNIDGTNTVVYTNPLLADTDGDGKKDGEERSTIKIEGATDILTTAISTHPAHKDYVYKININGGTDSTASPKVSVINGSWNLQTKLKVKAGQILTVRDLGDSQWGISTMMTGYHGYAPSSNPYPIKFCEFNSTPSLSRGCLTTNYFSLIGKFSTSSTMPGDLTDHFLDFGAGNEVNVVNGISSSTALPTPYLVRQEMDGKYLLLRNHHSYTASTMDPTANPNLLLGDLSVMIRVESPDDYPQQPPTADQEKILFQQLCPSIPQ
ncbi:MAG: hypothetical protein JWQ35_16 [Bacteriovoracaceae bacterium]|nr:hypothetical protein [Bacteriovoracaceae bacterium]